MYEALFSIIRLPRVLALREILTEGKNSKFEKCFLYIHGIRKDMVSKLTKRKEKEKVLKSENMEAPIDWEASINQTTVEVRGLEKVGIIAVGQNWMLEFGMWYSYKIWL